MSWQKVRDRLRRIEFNMTEPEVLRKLITSSKDAGEEIKQNNRNLASVASIISEEFMGRKFINRSTASQVADEMHFVAIDGSNYPVEGSAGEFHVPMSAVAVDFPTGLKSVISIRIDANVFTFQETDNTSVHRDISLTMLAMETKLLLLTAQELTKGSETVIMLDGPIVDPPWRAPSEYISNRCRAIELCLSHGCNILGIVKSPREHYFIHYLNENGFFKDLTGKIYNNDFYLFVHVFNQYRKRTSSVGPIYSNSIDISNEAIVDDYANGSIQIMSFFYQNSPTSRPLRIDWCKSREYESEDTNRLASIVSEASLPGIPYPIPVYLAHRKCSIRQGCAEILYDDIMTRARSSSREDALILEILRGR